MLEFIRDAGWGIYPVMIFGLAAIFAAVRHYFSPRKAHTITVKWLIALTGVAGVVGTITGLQASARHVHAVAEKWIFLVGLDEALNNMVAAGILITLAMLVMLVAHLRRDAAAPERAHEHATT